VPAAIHQWSASITIRSKTHANGYWLGRCCLTAGKKLRFLLSRRTSPQTDPALIQNATQSSPNDAFPSGSRSLPPLGLIPPVQNSSYSSSLIPSTTLPRRDFHSVVLSTHSSEEPDEEYDFNHPPEPTPHRSHFAEKFPVSVDANEDGAFPIRTVTGRQEQIIKGRLNQPILPPSLGCGTLDLLPKLQVEATTYNSELFYICK
jgi:hypothetical protein